MSEHIHYVGDGKGYRRVYCDGVKVERCIRANVQEGWAEFNTREVKDDAFVVGRVEGKIEVEFIPCPSK